MSVSESIQKLQELLDAYRQSLSRSLIIVSQPTTNEEMQSIARNMEDVRGQIKFIKIKLRELGIVVDDAPIDEQVYEVGSVSISASIIIPRNISYFVEEKRAQFFVQQKENISKQINTMDEIETKRVNIELFKTLQKNFLQLQSTNYELQEIMRYLDRDISELRVRSKQLETELEAERKSYESQLQLLRKGHESEVKRLTEGHTLEIKRLNERHESEVKRLKDRSIPIIALSFITALFAGIGGNLVTSENLNSIGLLLIIISIGTQVLIYFLSPKE